MARLLRFGFGLLCAHIRMRECDEDRGTSQIVPACELFNTER